MHRFVVIADLHAHPWAAFAKGDGLHNSRLQHTLRVLDTSLKYAQAEGIPWLFIGDLVHTAGYALNVVLAGIVEVLSKYPGVTKVAIWGNHDARGIGGKITIEQTVFASFSPGKFTILDPSLPNPIVTCRGLTISGAGYQPRPKLLEYGPPADIGLYHQTIRGSVAPNDFIFDEGIDPQELLKRHRITIVGHVHHPQQMDAPKGQAILIPGSPEHHNFGDREEHGWWVITLPLKADPEAEFMPGGSPEFCTVDTPAEVRDDGNYYRVRTMPKGTTLPTHATAIGPSPTTVKHRDLLHGAATLEQVLQLWLTTKPPPTVNGTKPTEYLAVGKTLFSQVQEPIRVRDIRLKKLILNNFCSFQATTLTIQDGVWLIMGTGRDYTSNGAGKSTLVGEALYWLLFGRTTKGMAADEVIRWGTKTAHVTALLEEADGSFLAITRTKGRHSTLEVVPWKGNPAQEVVGGPAWEASSVTEMTEKLSNYLGVTPEIYQNLAYFSQEKLLLFSSATDGERKDVLADLIGLGAYQEASAQAGAHISKLGQELVINTAKTEYCEEERKRLESRLAAAQDRAIAWEDQHAGEVQDAQDALQRVREDSHLPLAQEQMDGLPARVQDLVATYTMRREAERDVLAEEVRNQLLSNLEGQRTKVELDILLAQTQLQHTFPKVEAAREALKKLPAVRKKVEQETKILHTLEEEEHKCNLAWREHTVQLHTTQQESIRVEQELDEAKQMWAAGICPTCKQKVDNKHQEECLQPLRKRKKELLTTELKWDKALEQDSTARSNAAKPLNKSRRKLEQLGELLHTLTEAESHFNRLEIYQKQLDDLQQVDEAIVQKRTAEELSRLIGAYKQKQKVRLQRVRKFVATLKREHEQTLLYQEKEAERLNKETNPHEEDGQRITSHLHTLKKQLKEGARERKQAERNVEIYDYWRQGFSKQGLQSLLVEEVATLFNANRSEVFALLTQGIYDVQFSTLSSTKSGELRERTEFFITERGRPVPYASLSGGQRRRIDIGIMLVLAQVVAQWMQTSGLFGLLILDEVFGFLDESGAEGLLETLRQVNEQIPTIYVVTQDVRLQAMFPNVLRVKQNEEGISSIV